MAGNKNQMVQMLLWMTIAFCWMTVGSACKCAIRRDENYCRNDIVFQGKAIDSHRENAHPETIRTYVVEVDRIFWSNISIGGRVLDLTTASSVSLCGASFQLNTPYVIAASEDQSYGHLWTGFCTGNTLWNDLDENRKMFFTDRLHKLCASYNHLD